MDFVCEPFTVTTSTGKIVEVRQTANKRRMFFTIRRSVLGAVDLEECEALASALTELRCRQLIAQKVRAS